MRILKHYYFPLKHLKFYFKKGEDINTFKYVSSTDGKILVRIKIGITFIFRFRRTPIQVVVFFPVGLSSFLRNSRQPCWVSKFLLSPGLGS